MSESTLVIYVRPGLATVIGRCVDGAAAVRVELDHRVRQKRKQPEKRGVLSGRDGPERRRAERRGGHPLIVPAVLR